MLYNYYMSQKVKKIIGTIFVLMVLVGAGYYLFKTKIGTINNHGEILIALSIAANFSEISGVPDVFKVKPMMIKMIKVMIIVGMVVKVMYLICVKRSVPAIAGARFVVSDKGDILSPK